VIWERARKEIDLAKEEFKLIEREIKKDKKKKIFWKQLIEE
jgi:hypothetical protein